MEIDVKEITEMFGLKLNDYTKVRSVYKCETDMGIMNLKEVLTYPDKILFEYYLKKHLYDNGFTNIDMYILSNDNMPYVTYNNRSYIMTKWLEGRECDLENEDEMRLAVINLAKLHECSKGFNLVDFEAIKCDIGKLDAMYLKRKKELERIKGKIKKEIVKTEFEKLYVTSADLFIDEANLAIDVLNKSKYFDIVANTIKEKSFCHHDYAFHNLIIDRNENLSVIDFEYATYEIRVYDIANVIKRSMRKCNWDIEKTKRILKYYKEVSDITKDELYVLYAMLIFPQKLWRIMNRYYNGKKNLSFDSNTIKLLNEINLYPYHQKFIDDYKKEILENNI